MRLSSERVKAENIGIIVCEISRSLSQSHWTPG